MTRPPKSSPPRGRLRKQSTGVRRRAEMLRAEGHKNALRDAAARWAQEFDPTYFVTLTFADKEGTSFVYAKTVFGRFVRHLRSSLYGPDSRKRFPMFPVVEKYCRSNERQREVGTHIHLLINLQGDPAWLAVVVAQAWRKSGKFCGDPKKNTKDNNDLWFKPINNDDIATTFSDYIVKTCRDNMDAVLLDFVHIKGNDLKARPTS